MRPFLTRFSELVDNFLFSLVGSRSPDSIQSPIYDVGDRYLTIRLADGPIQLQHGPAERPRAQTHPSPKTQKRNTLPFPPGLHHTLEMAAKTNRGEMVGGENDLASGLRPASPGVPLAANHIPTCQPQHWRWPGNLLLGSLSLLLAYLPNYFPTCLAALALASLQCWSDCFAIP